MIGLIWSEVGLSAAVSEDFEAEAYDGCLSIYGLFDGFFGVVLCGFVLFEFLLVH